MSQQAWLASEPLLKIETFNFKVIRLLKPKKFKSEPRPHGIIQQLEALNSGFEYSYGVDSRILRWIYFLDLPTLLGNSNQKTAKQALELVSSLLPRSFVASSPPSVPGSSGSGSGNCKRPTWNPKVPSMTAFVSGFHGTKATKRRVRRRGLHIFCKEQSASIAQEVCSL